MVELVRAGRTAEELAAEFEPTAQSIRNWVVQADRDEGHRQDGLTSAEKEELARLRREVRQLREEREILKKAAVQSTDQRNSAASLSPGVSNSRVLRGRVFSLWAIRSRSSWARSAMLVPLGRY